MTVFYLALVSFLMLFLPMEWQALQMRHLGEWRFLLEFFTHQLGHGGIDHLIGNYMFMIPYAIFLEAKLGRRRFLTYYFSCGILAALSQMAGAPGAGLIGSSGAAYGVFAGACASFGDKLWQRVAGFSLLGFSMLRQFSAAIEGSNLGIGFWAHFGGAIGGLALMHFFFSRPSTPNQEVVDTKA